MSKDSKFLQLSKADRDELQKRLSEFAQSWTPRSLDEHLADLPEAPHPLRRALLEGLVRIDLEMRWQQGQSARLEEYLGRFPELGTTDSVSTKLILAEFQARQRFGKRSLAQVDGEHGSSANLRELAERFPDQADKLRDLADEDSDDDSAVQLDASLTDSGGSSIISRGSSETLEEDVSLPEVFGGRYRILRRLGTGGMGAVYLAEDTRLERQVALKVPQLFAQKTGDDPNSSRYADITENLERFYREARAAATIHHPNLCPVFDVGEIDGLPYLTMAFIEGWPLSRFAKKDKRLSQLATAAIIRKVALGVHEAHKLGILHRDLKPANVMINKRGEPIVMDFGLARWLHNDQQDQRLTRTGAIMGAPVYMSPEQVYGDPEAMGPPSDVYSLGVILYELLTSRLPFEGPSVTSTLAKTLMLEPQKPSDHRSDIDPKLERICLKAMAKKTSDRFGDMKELADALGAYMRESRGDSAVQKPTKKQPPKKSTPDAIFESGPKAPPKKRDRSITAEPKRRPRIDSIGKAPPPSDGVPAWIWAVGVLLLIAGAAAGVWFFLVSTSSGTVQIVVIPASATNYVVQLDGAPLDAKALKEPLELERGNHEIIISGADYQPVRRKFAVASGENPPIRIELKPNALAVPPRPPIPEYRNPTRTIQARAGVPTNLAIWPAALDGYPGTSVRDRGVRFATVGRDGMLRSWDLLKFKGIQPIRAQQKAAHALSFARDGKTILVGGNDNVLRLFDWKTKKAVREFTGHTQKVNSCAFSPDGKTVLSGASDNKVILWDSASGKSIHHLVVHGRSVNAVAFSSDGALAGSVDEAGVLIVWDAKTGKAVLRKQGNPSLSTIGFHPRDGNVCLAGTRPGSLRLVNFRNGQVVREYFGHSSPIESVAISPGGRLVASSSSWGVVLLHDFDTGEPIGRFVGHDTKGVSGVVFTPDGTRLLTCDRGRLIREWALPRKLFDPPALPDALAVTKPALTMTGHKHNVESVEFLPGAGSPRAVSGGHDRDLIVWNLETGKLERRLKGHQKPIHDIAVTPDGSRVITAGWDSKVGLWNPAADKPIDMLNGHGQAAVESVALSPRQDFLASGGADNKVFLWNWVTKKEARRLGGHRQRVAALAFDRTGNLLVSVGRDGQVFIWNVNNFQKVGVVHPNPIKPLHSVAVSPVGATVAVGGQSTTIYLLDHKTKNVIDELHGHTAIVTGLDFSADGRWLASCSDDKTVRLWDVETGQEVARFVGHTAKVWGVALSDDGRHVISCGTDRTVRLWALPSFARTIPIGAAGVIDAKAEKPTSLAVSTKTGEAITGTKAGELIWWEIDGRTKSRTVKAHEGPIHSVATDRLGWRVASGGADSLVKVWSVERGELLHKLEGHEAPVTAVAFAPNGSRLVTGDEKGAVRVWNMKNGQPLTQLKGHSARISDIAVHTPRSILTASVDGSVKLWSVDAADPIRTLNGHPKGKIVCAVSPDGRFALTGATDKKVRFWNLGTGQNLRTFSGPSNAIESVRFSEEGELFAAGCADRRVRLWQKDKPNPIRTFGGSRGPVIAVEFHPDGRRLVSCSTDGTVRMWGLPLR